MVVFNVAFVGFLEKGPDNRKFPFIWDNALIKGGLKENRENIGYFGCANLEKFARNLVRAGSFRRVDALEDFENFSFRNNDIVICGLSVLSEGAGCVNSWSGFENTLQNCSLKRFAFCFGSVTQVSLSKISAIPVFSFLCDFM